MPEGWGNPKKHILNNNIEPPQGSGILGLETWFMTKFTADMYPQLVSYHGLAKPENRELLASVFKRPTTWGDYCKLVSENNCSAADKVAQSALIRLAKLVSCPAAAFMPLFLRGSGESYCLQWFR